MDIRRQDRHFSGFETEMMSWIYAFLSREEMRSGCCRARRTKTTKFQRVQRLRRLRNSNVKNAAKEQKITFRGWLNACRVWLRRFVLRRVLVGKFMPALSTLEYTLFFERYLWNDWLALSCDTKPNWIIKKHFWGFSSSSIKVMPFEGYNLNCRRYHRNCNRLTLPWWLWDFKMYVYWLLRNNGFRVVGSNRIIPWWLENMP